MRNKIALLFFITIVLFCGCKKESENTNIEPTENISIQSQSEIPALIVEPTAQPLLLPEDVDLNADPMNIVEKYVYNYNIIMHEDYTQMISNDFEQFELKNLDITGNDNGVTLFALKEYSNIDLVKTLEEFSADGILPEQAIMIRFKSPTQNTSFDNTLFSLSKEDGATSFSFYNSKFPATGAGNTGMPFVSGDDGNFVLKQDVWCYAFMTLDDYSNSRILIWHEGEAGNMSRHFSRGILDDRDQSHIEPIREGKLSFSIDIGKGESIEISDYWIFEYEGLKR